MVGNYEHNLEKESDDVGWPHGVHSCDLARQKKTEIFAELTVAKLARHCRLLQWMAMLLLALPSVASERFLL